MKLTELESILEQLLENKTAMTVKSKTIMLNNMLAMCRNLSSMYNIVDSFPERDDYVNDVKLEIKELASDFCSATVKKLMAEGINILDEFDDSRPQTRRIVIQDNPYAQPQMDPMMAGYYQQNSQFMQQPQMPPYPNQQYQAQQQPYGAPYPNQTYPQQYAQPSPVSPQAPYVEPTPAYEPEPTVTPPPVQPAPAQPAPAQPAPAQTAPIQPAPTVAPTPEPAPTQASEQPTSSPTPPPQDFNILAGFGNDDGKPAAGRDFLLSILNK